MTREQIEEGQKALRVIKETEAELTMLREMNISSGVYVSFGQYGNVHADEDLLKRLIAVCIAHNENKLSQLEEELKKL